MVVVVGGGGESVNREGGYQSYHSFWKVGVLGLPAPWNWGFFLLFKGPLTTIGVFFFQSFFAYFLKDCLMLFVLIITFLVHWLSSPHYKTHLVIFTFTFLSSFFMFCGIFSSGMVWQHVHKHADIRRVNINASSVPHLCSYKMWN